MAANKNSKNKKKNDLRSRECYGKVTKVGRDLFGPGLMRVKYTVGTEEYEIREAVGMKNNYGKGGIFEVMAKGAVTKIPNLQVGTRVTVCYDPENPKNAYIKGNR